MAAIMEGRITRLQIPKGFGFIEPDGGDHWCFFHRSDVVGSAFQDLYEGQPVTFEETRTIRGPRAIAVRGA